MANSNTPYGLRAYAYMSGAPYNGAVRTYYVPVGNATALYFGDPVNLVAGSSDGNGVSVAEIASAGSTHQILGTYAGISNNAGVTTIPLLQSQTPYLPAATAAYIYVTDDPFLLYAIQENSIGGGGSGGYILSNAAASANGNLIAGTGSTATSQSGWMLDSSTVEHAGSDSTLQLRLIQLLQSGDNAIGVSAKWLVKINQGLSAFTNPASGGT
jgi:hypothetical protein